MSGLRSPYIGEVVQRQSPPFRRILALTAISLSLTGCTSLADFEKRGDATGTVPTAPSAAAAKPGEGIDPSDWEAIRLAFAGSRDAPANNVEIDWSNPRTGSAGTITTLAFAQEKPGGLCQAFATTINDTRGVRRYRGEACLETNGRWRLTAVIPEDGKLL